MFDARRSWLQTKLDLLSLLAPKKAGKLATELFVQSRSASNPRKEGFTPIGAKDIALEDRNNRVKNIYLWGDSGDIVLLLHGWGADCSTMFGFVRSLTRQGYRVATFDAPAHGSSEGEIATMFEYVETTKKVIEQLGDVKKVIGHSLGGIVSVAANAMNPQIEQLVLISTPFSLMDVLNIWCSSFMRLSKDIKHRILDELLEVNGVPVSYWDVGLHGQTWEIPIMVIHDKKDPIVSYAHADRIASSLPSTHLRTVEGLGHIKILMNRDVHQEVVNFFEEFSKSKVPQNLALN